MASPEAGELTEEEKLAARAKRWGLTGAAVGAAGAATAAGAGEGEEEEAKMAARAKRCEKGRCGRRFLEPLRKGCTGQYLYPVIGSCLHYLGPLGCDCRTQMSKSMFDIV